MLNNWTTRTDHCTGEIRTGANNGQINALWAMAVKLYSDISGLLTIFITVDRDAGENSATSFGPKRYSPLK